ncbi:MAG TPA: hypothetical protein V6D22_16895 [Candidatus Obscuribacterales bacterium]
MAKAEYQQAFLEPFTSEKMQKLAVQIWNFVLYCQDSRRPREKTIFECDEAYLCHRYVPDVGAMQLIEDGEFGESDVFDNMNYMSIRQTLALMPRNQPWLTVSSREGEADLIIQAIQDHQIYMHKKARTRRNWQRHRKQKNIRGRSGIYWEWREEKVWRRIDDVADNAKQLNAWLKRAGIKKADAGKLTKGRYPHIINAGPSIYPIDWYDLWVDPSADLVNHRRPAKIVRRFRVLEDLMSEMKDDVPEPKYDKEVLKQITPLTFEQIYSNWDYAGGRTSSQRIFGTVPSRMTSGIKFVPVYICYFPHLEFDYNGTKEHYWDTYFHIAIDGTGNKPFLIYAEENPSDLGHSHIIVDDCVDWVTPWASGGIGLVEKQLSRYHQKNLLKLLMVTAAAHSIFPPVNVLANALREDEEYGFGPGEINVIQENPLGLAAIAPMQVPERGAALGEQILRFYGEDMRASSGLDGLAIDNPARSMSKPKTATEVNRDQSTGSLLLDNEAENDAEVLSELVMSIFEESQKRLLPNAEGMLDYERYLGDKVIQGNLSLGDFRAKRSIQVLGVQGAENRAQELQNLLQGLDISSRLIPAMPMAIPFAQTALVQTWRKLNIPMPDQLENMPLQMPQMMPPGMPPQIGMQGGAPPPAPPGAPDQGNVIDLSQFMGAMNGPGNASAAS